MALEKELETFRKKLPELKEHEGKFVLIHGETVEDFFATYEDAIKAGYQKFKLEPFLVKQVNAIETVQHVTRHILPYSRKRLLSGFASFHNIRHAVSTHCYDGCGGEHCSRTGFRG